jgi:hypothetical protein
MNENIDDFLNSIGVDAVKIQLDESTKLAGQVIDAAGDIKDRAISVGLSHELAEEMAGAFFGKVLFGE